MVYSSCAQCSPWNAVIERNVGKYCSRLHRTSVGPSSRRRASYCRRCQAGCNNDPTAGFFQRIATTTVVQRPIGSLRGSQRPKVQLRTPYCAQMTNRPRALLRNQCHALLRQLVVLVTVWVCLTSACSEIVSSASVVKNTDAGATSHLSFTRGGDFGKIASADHYLEVAPHDE